MGRPEILARPGIVFWEAGIVLAPLVAVANEVDADDLWCPDLADEDDNSVLEIAVAYGVPCDVFARKMGQSRPPDTPSFVSPPAEPGVFPG